MAKKKSGKSLPLLCTACTQFVEWKLDKYKRPYVVCSTCGMRIFFKTTMCQLGYKLCSDLLHANLEVYQKELQARFGAEMLRLHREREGQEENEKQRSVRKAKAKKDAASKKRIKSYRSVAANPKQAKSRV